jgi:hypothetical protein
MTGTSSTRAGRISKSADLFISMLVVDDTWK